MSDRNKPTDPEWVNRQDPSSLPRYSTAQGGPAAGSGKGEDVGYAPASNAAIMLKGKSKDHSDTAMGTATSVSDTMDQRYEMPNGQMKYPSGGALGTVGAETHRKGETLDDDPSRMEPTYSTGTAADIGNKGATRTMAERRGEGLNKGYGLDTEVREKAGTEGGVKGKHEGEERYGRSGPDNFAPSDGGGERSGGGLGKNWAT